MSNKKIALIIPTLNEIDGLKSIMPAIKKEWLNEIVFIDGNSTDGTIEYIKKQGYTLFLEDGKGLRTTELEVIDKIDSEIIITFSPDGNCIPELIPKLIDKIKEGYDMVIVSRYLDGAKSYDDSLLTGFGNWMFTKIANILFKAKYTDCLGIYRAYKKQMIKDLDLNKENTYAVPERLFGLRISWEPILSIRAAKRKLKIIEIAGDEPKRIGGKAKLKPFRCGGACLFLFLRDKLFWK